MTLNKNIWAIVGVCAAIFVTALLTVMAFSQPDPAYGSSFPMVPAMTAATTTGSVSVTVSARILATTTNTADTNNNYTRAYTVICNASTNPVYLNLDGDKPAGIGKVTAIIAAAAGYNACFELTDDRMIYSGSITASSTAETATVVSYKQYVY